MRASPSFLRPIVLSALLLVPPVLLRGQPSPLPPGSIEFAGRLSHHHWHVLGEGYRAELDSLNREMREMDRRWREASEGAARAEAERRARRGADRLRELVVGCPALLRLDVTAAAPSLSPAGPVTQPGESGALLFEVQAGGAGMTYSAASIDLSEPRGESSRAVVDIAPAGVTCAVLGLERLPVGTTTLVIEFRRPGGSSFRQSLDVVTPAPGRLKLTVLSDDTGRPTPAMVRLMWRVDGLQRRPPNGIEFATQFDGQGSATGVRAANLPGELGVHFWCVPGPFDMALSPGVWQIGVRRGVEHRVVFEDVTIPPGGTVERTIRPRRWTDLRQRGWWSGDDHVHTRIVSDDDARNVMAWVKAEDVHLANVVKMGDIYRTYFEQRGFGPAHRVVDGEHVLCPGQECPRTHDQIGHTLAMNITAMVRDPASYFLYDRVFDAVHAQGGLSGYAHVNSGLFHVHRDMSLNVPRGKVDFAEILQFNRLGTDLYYEFLNLGCKLTASAGSDVPWGGTVGEVRAYAYLGRKRFTADNWFAAFGRGRTFTTSGPMVELRVDHALPGDELRLKQDRPLRVRARAWGDPGRMAPLRLELVRHGEVIHRVESARGSGAEVVADLRTPAGHGCWIAARVLAADGTSAHTTPVYVIREGFRFWKFDAIESLLAAREESLRQIETIVAEARRRTAGGDADGDRYVQLLAEQGGALIERVAEAREVYAGLRRTAAAERPARAPVPAAH